MKHGALRAAAHNVADSLTSGCSLAFGYHELPFWDLVGQSPEGVVGAEIVSGKTRTEGVPDALVSVFRTTSALLPDFLAKHHVDPSQVRRIELTFRRIASTTSLRTEVLITVEDCEGRATTDRYIGCPLRRPVIVDSLGRRRTVRSPMELTRPTK